MNTKNKIIVSITAIIFSLIINHPASPLARKGGLSLITNAKAINMSSPAYEIDMSNLNMVSGRKSGSGLVVSDTVGQTAPGRYDSTGYVVKAGFQYIHSILPFSFTISDLSIDFGSLTPGTPATLENTLSVTAGSAGGWQVTAFENHEMRNQTESAEIPDAKCNDPVADPCTPTDAKVWTDNDDYGFGYSISGDNVDTDDFVDDSYFRPFANQEESESPAEIMASSESTSSATATVTYKVNISPQQSAGNYQNYLVFIATPTY